jgi:hypothetical protein
MEIEAKLTLTPDEFAFENGIINEATKIIARLKLLDCYHEIIKILKYYLDMNENQYKLIAIWIIATYWHKDFDAFPYLFFNAMRGSGKTRTLKLISSIGAKGDGSVQNNLTEAVLFRIQKGVVTCIDEMEQVGKKEKQTLRELLNSAYKKGTKVKRMKKVHLRDGSEEQQVVEYEPYFPIAIANIWGMDEVLGDRSITLILEKSNNPAVTKKIENFDNPIISKLKRTLKQISDVSDVTLCQKTYKEDWNRWLDNLHTTSYNITTTLTSLTSQNNTREEAEKNLDILKQEELFSKINDLGIAGRNFELFWPLLVVANNISLEVFEDVCKIASEFCTVKKDDEYNESKDVLLFEFITTLVSFGNDFFMVKELNTRFRNFVGDLDDKEDTWLNEKWLGKALKRLNLRLENKHTNVGSKVRLNYEKAKEKLKMFKPEVKEE